MRYLKENTATRVTVGPFLDVTDGFTPEIALTATNEHITFIVDDAGVPTLVIDTTATASGGSNDLVHITSDAGGFYDLELAAANVNYTGRAMLQIHYSTDHLPVFHEFQIVSANVYDSLFTDGDVLDVNAIQAAGTAWGSGAITAASLGADCITAAKIADDAIVAANLATGALTADAFAADAIVAATLATGALTADAFAANALVAATFAADCITAAKIADDSIAAEHLKADAVTKIWAEAVESNASITAQEALSVILSAVAGVTTSAGSVLKDPSGTTTRITATINASNERTAMTLVPSS